MAKNIIRTHKGIASKASKEMRNVSKTIRRVAASALSNRRKGAK
jgi:hypothetical protein